MSTYKMVCPHCRSLMRVRSSVGLHIFMRITYLQCTNEVCSWSVRGEFTMTHQLSPSGMPNPAVKLPLADSFIRQLAMKKEADKQAEFEFEVEQGHDC